jgi:hypothetical protein
LVVLTSSGGTPDPQYQIRNVVDLRSESVFVSRNEPNQWICLDFKNMTIIPTHIAIQGPYWRPGFSPGWGHGRRRDPDQPHPHPQWTDQQSWRVEGSVDGRDWIELDVRRDVHFFNARKGLGAFALSRSEKVRMIRLTQIGDNYKGEKSLELSAFEVFSKLFESPKTQ